ncbi:site-2 protease family protein [Candidatus Altiarchaeota archaeon]
MRIFGVKFTGSEVYELLAAWMLLSIAFSILYSGTDLDMFIRLMPICAASVGLGFVLHELGHKVYAQRYGLEAHFKANYQGLMLAVLMSFMGFIYVAPGAVWIRGVLSRRQNGIISMAGPLINIILGVGFLSLYFSPLSANQYIGLTAYLGYMINTWVGLFNLIPSQPFDGAKIMAWNKGVYFSLVFMAGGLYLSSYII